MSNANYKQLLKFKEQIEKLQEHEIDTFKRNATNEMGQRFYAKVVKRTPVGQYPAGSGKVGGTLRRGWRIGQVKKITNGYEVQISNNVFYASYVNYGHRTRNGGWWTGYFYKEKSELELESEMPKLLERKLVKFLQDKMK